VSRVPFSARTQDQTSDVLMAGALGKLRDAVSSKRSTTAKEKALESRRVRGYVAAFV